LQSDFCAGVLVENDREHRIVYVAILTDLDRKIAEEGNMALTYGIYTIQPVVLSKNYAE
jgi:hypothetical protein